MSEAPDNFASLGPAWNDFPVMIFAGQRDTHIHTGEDYDTASLGSLFIMEPGDKPKEASPAFIPSSYHNYDGREHAAQREHGSFVALCGDVDKGDIPLQRIEALTRGFAGDAAWLIYSSAHSRPGDRRWRVILPIAAPLPFAGWHDAQHAFFAFMEFSGVAMDRALDRAGQPVYLPNVPAEHVKSGQALRSDRGEPLYFQRSTSGSNAPGLDPTAGTVSAWLATLRRQREDDETERQRIRMEAEARRARQPASDGGNVMADFNQASSLANLLELYGYERSPRHADDWRSPHQTGETYATRIIGDKWISLSGSDAVARVGEQCKSGCFGDAYDLFVHYEHKGDHKAAHRALHAERKASATRTAGDYIPESGEDADYDQDGDLIRADMGDYGDDDLMPVALPILQASAAARPPETDLPVFSPADWQGQPSPVRVWRWDSFIPDYQATLLTGAGAAGKSLAMQQMCTCVAMGIDFLGVPVRQAPALYITCEDDMEELHRRQEAICTSLGISLEATRGKLFLLSLQGAVGNELANFAPDGRMTIAPRYLEIEAVCLALGVQHVTIDNTAHTFAGNENDRHQVAAFVGLNNKLAQTISGSVVMVGHPNKAGDSYSGSTAWENQVRSRLYLEIPRNGDDGVPIDPDMRVLRNEKANYSQRGAEVRFFWVKGAFVLEDQIEQSDRDTSESTQAFHENTLFLNLLETLSQQRRNVSHKTRAGNYAPKVMAGMPAAKGYSKAQLERAMERLFMLGKIDADASLWLGKNRHPVVGLGRI